MRKLAGPLYTYKIQAVRVQGLELYLSKAVGVQGVGPYISTIYRQYMTLGTHVRELAGPLPRVCSPTP